MKKSLLLLVWALIAIGCADAPEEISYRSVAMLRGFMAF